MEEYGSIIIHIEDILKEKNISKNKLCFDLRIQRGQLNRYCRSDVQRLDVHLLCRLCHYFGCNVSDILEYTAPEKRESEE